MAAASGLQPRRRGGTLEDPVGLAHGGLDVEALDVLPVLLEQGDQEVDRVVDVGADLLLRHGHVGDGHAHAQHLLQLELDGRLGLGHLQSTGAGAGVWASEGCAE